MILGLARDDKTVLREYLRNRHIRLQEAKNNSQEFEEIGSEELEEFLEKELNLKLNEVDSITYDRMKIVYYTQLQEQKLTMLQGIAGKF